MIPIEDSLKVMREVLFDYPKRFDLNTEQLKKLQGEENDLLHAIELVNLNAYEGFKMYKRLQKVRQEKRALKDENKILAPIVKSMSKNKIKIHEINSLIGNTRNMLTNQKVRSYRMRVRSDMQCLVDNKVVTKS